ncbi:MAG TPA: pilin [Candidatus Paceibacterota bacterium]|nr:pilin [Candidatus Paceibacterota bacterium]
MPLGNFIVWIIGFINHVLVPFIFAIAFIVFIWGIFQYFIAGGADEEKRKEGKKLALYGFIGFFLMISIWGIVNLLVNSTGFDNKSRPALPTFGDVGGAGGGFGNNKGGTVLTCSPESEYSPAGLSPDECCKRAFGPESSFNSSTGCTNAN